jgi:hypothetical protein
MTNLELIEFVEAHLIKQGKKSTMPYCTTECAYRGENGNMCAAGCLITDEFYSTDLEGRNVKDEDVEFALIASGVPQDQIYIVGALQNIHDSYLVREWEREIQILKSMVE